MYAIPLQYAYGCIQNSVVEIHDLQCRIDHFRSAPVPACLVLVLGVTNHWVTLLAFRVKGDTEHQIEERGLLYLDSNNEPVLAANNSDLVSLIEKRENERIRRKGRGYSEWKRGVMYQAFVDQRDVVQLLAEVLYGSKSLCSEVMRTQWTRLLASYREHVVQPLGDSADKGLYTSLLLNWLETYCRPQIMKDTHVFALEHLGAHRLPGTLKVQVESWMHDCLDRCEPGIDIVDSFLTVLHDIANILNLN